MRIVEKLKGSLATQDSTQESEYLKEKKILVDMIIGE